MIPHPVDPTHPPISIKSISICFAAAGKKASFISTVPYPVVVNIDTDAKNTVLILCSKLSKISLEILEEQIDTDWNKTAIYPDEFQGIAKEIIKRIEEGCDYCIYFPERSKLLSDLKSCPAPFSDQ